MTEDAAVCRRVLSFDVGLKHLAYADLRVVEGTSNVASIERWGVIDATAGLSQKQQRSAEALTAAVVEALDTEFFDPASARYDVVLVENQPSRKNPAMKSVQVAIVAYFATIRAHVPACVGEVRLISASRKLAADSAEGDGEGGTDGDKTAAQAYRARKARSVELCRRAFEAPDGRLSSAAGAAEASATLKAAKKKDDLADAMLQALAYLDAGSGTKKRTATKKKT